MNRDKDRTTQTRTTPLAVPQTEKSVQPKKLIYVGPTLVGLKSLTSFTGGLPAEAQTLISRDAKYNRLFVPVSGFIKAIKDVKEGGLKEIYRQATMERF